MMRSLVALAVLAALASVDAGPVHTMDEAIHHEAMHHAIGTARKFDIRANVLGFTGSQFEQILEQIHADQDHLLAPSNDAVYGTPLANLYIRLQRYLFKKGVLPVDDFGRPQPGKDYKEDWSEAPHLPRLSINRYWEQVKHMVPAGARCMEHFPSFYTRQHPHCKEAWTFDYHGGDPARARIDHASKTLYDDVANLTMAAAAMEGTFDVIAATQVLELPSNPYRAAQTWYRLLKPGGLLLTTQPFCERDVFPATGWPDHFRFTDAAVEGVLRDAGFEVEQVYMGGDQLLTTGFLMGFGTEDFSEDELRAAFYPRNDTSRRSAIYYNTMVVARKPAHGGGSSGHTSGESALEKYKVDTHDPKSAAKARRSW